LYRYTGRCCSACFRWGCRTVSVLKPCASLLARESPCDVLVVVNGENALKHKKNVDSGKISFYYAVSRKWSDAKNLEVLR